MALSYKSDPKTNSDDDELNPYNRQSTYDPSSLSEAEQTEFDDIVGNYNDEADSSQEDDNIEYARQIADRESAPRAGWQNNVSAASNLAKGQAGKGKVASLVGKTAKKGGPAGIIIALVLGAAGLVSFFGGPGLLIVHMVETITSKFDPMSTILTERSDTIINAKLKNSTAGFCTSKVTIKCKYSLMSNRQIERFNSNSSGVRMIVDEGGSRIPGFNRATAIEFEGRTITPDRLRAEMRSDPKLRTAMIDAYNWRFLSKSYKPFLSLAGIRGLTKKPQFDPEDSLSLIHI